MLEGGMELRSSELTSALSTREQVCKTPPLSPAAAPFYPTHCGAGRSKPLRWADVAADYDSDSSGDFPMSPPAAAMRAPPPDTKQKLAPPLRSVLVCSGAGGRLAAGASSQIHPTVGASCPAPSGGTAPWQRRRPHRHHAQPRPQLVHGLPHRGRDGCPPPRRVRAHHRLGPKVSRHHHVTPPNAHGWQDVLPRDKLEPRRSTKPHGTAAASGKTSPARVCDFAARFRGRCFRCLARDHKVAACRDPPRCFRCNCSGHFSKHCATRPRLDKHRPDRKYSSSTRRPVHDRLRFPGEFPPLVVTAAPHLGQADKRQSYCPALLGGGRRGWRRSTRHRSACRRGAYDHGLLPHVSKDSEADTNYNKPPSMMTEDPLMASMDKRASLYPLSEEKERYAYVDPMLIEACLGPCYQSRYEPCRPSAIETSMSMAVQLQGLGNASVQQEEGINSKGPAPMPVPNENAEDADLEEPLPEAVITPATRPIWKTSTRGGHRRSALPESAQRRSARLAAKASIVPVSLRGTHRLALQFEKLDPDNLAEPTGDEAVKLYLERYGGVPPPHVTVALAALASVRRKPSVTLAGEEEKEE